VIEVGQTARSECDLSNLDELLPLYSSNFVKLRYPYERYRGMTEYEYHERGRRWAEAGSPLEEADFVYHPAELGALTHGLMVEIESWLGADPG